MDTNCQKEHEILLAVINPIGHRDTRKACSKLEDLCENEFYKEISVSGE